MNNLVENTISKYNLINKGDNIVVALSGGADSVALLNVLYSIKEKYALNIFAAHVNHNIRGDEAKRDEEFCKFLCKNYDIELFIKNIDVKSLAAKQKISEELCGRNVRYDFFAELSDKLSAKTATAHTASDNAETLIFNIIRGASVNGLGAIPPKRGNIIRPLIEVTRDEIERYCRENSLEFVTDSTNLADDYTRNNIRHNLIPILKSINPAFENTAMRLSKSAREISEFLEKSALSALDECRLYFGYDCKKLTKLDISVLKQVVIILCKKYNINPEQRHISLLCKIIKDGGSVELSKIYTAVSKQGIFRIIKTYDEKAFEPVSLKSDTNFMWNGKKYSVKELTDSVNKNTVCSDILLCNACFRTRREKDTFTYPKRKITKPLRKVMGELKIPCEQRDKILVLATGNTVLWCEYVGVSLQGMAENAENALKIEINEVY